MANRNNLITAYTDSDWAGCHVSCRSTSGGIIAKGSHVLKSYSKQQRTVALSSAEAELHATVAASSEALGIIALLRDMGCEADGEVYSDSTAALGIAQRQGMGKLRHIRTQALWVQEARVEGRLKYAKILGGRNPADALTKYMPSTLLDQHLKTVGLESRGGRAESAPELNAVTPYTERKALKIVRFSGKVEVKWIASEGKARPLQEVKVFEARWRESMRQTKCSNEGVHSRGTDEHQYEQRDNTMNFEGEIGGRRSEFRDGVRGS